LFEYLAQLKEIDAVRLTWPIFFAYFLQFVVMRQQNNHNQSWLGQTRYLPMINRSSGHQNQQIR
jgi:hypothetical protein